MVKLLAFVFLIQAANASVAQVNSSQTPPNDFGSSSARLAPGAAISNVAPGYVPPRGIVMPDSLSLLQCRNIQRHAKKVPSLKAGADYRNCTQRYGDLPDSTAESGVDAHDVSAKRAQPEVVAAPAGKK